MSELHVPAVVSVAIRTHASALALDKQCLGFDEGWRPTIAACIQDTKNRIADFEARFMKEETNVSTSD